MKTVWVLAAFDKRTGRVVRELELPDMTEVVARLWPRIHPASRVFDVTTKELDAIQPHVAETIDLDEFAYELGLFQDLDGD